MHCSRIATTHNGCIFNETDKLSSVGCCFCFCPLFSAGVCNNKKPKELNNESALKGNSNDCALVAWQGIKRSLENDFILERIKRGSGTNLFNSVGGSVSSFLITKTRDQVDSLPLTTSSRRADCGTSNKVLLDRCETGIHHS